jgi:NADH-quinone oxidoreductase subunit N
MLVGNLAAIAQSNLKRMLAYSSIAQMGFMLLGLVSGVVNGTTVSASNAYSSAMFYIVTYVLTTLGQLRHDHGAVAPGPSRAKRVNDLAGLNQAQPAVRRRDDDLRCCRWPACRPLVGFYAKLAVLQAMVTSGVSASISAWRCWLGGAVADRRVLLPARDQGDVLRRARRRPPPCRSADATCAPCSRSTAR